MGVALYPGSFDPIHNGHVAVIETAAAVFDRLIVAVARNSTKSGLISIPDRVGLISLSVAHLSNVEVETFDGLTTEAATAFDVSCVVKGLRNASDFDVEMAQAAMNARTGDLKTIFIPGFGSDSLLSSRYVREVAGGGGDVSSVVPKSVADYFANYPEGR